MGAGPGGWWGPKGQTSGRRHFFDDHRGLVCFCVSTCSHPHWISVEWMTRIQGGLLAHCWLIFFLGTMSQQLFLRRRNFTVRIHLHPEVLGTMIAFPYHFVDDS